MRISTELQPLNRFRIGIVPLNSCSSVPSSPSPPSERSLNGFVIAILLSQLRKKTKLTTSNKFTINQLVLDLYSCMAAILVYGWKMMNTRTDRKWNYITCVLIGSESILWAGVNGSITNLVFITLERYVKIVHSMAHKRYYRNWITSVCIALSWLNGMLCSVPATLVTVSYSDFPKGVCEALIVWPHPYDGQIFGCYTIVSFYFTPLLVFIVCYSRIIAAILNSASNFQVTTSNSRAASVTRHNSVALIKNHGHHNGFIRHLLVPQRHLFSSHPVKFGCSARSQH